MIIYGLSTVYSTEIRAVNDGFLFYVIIYRAVG